MTPRPAVHPAGLFRFRGMPRGRPAVLSGQILDRGRLVKRTLIAAAVAFATAASLQAQHQHTHAAPTGDPLDAQTDKLVRQALPLCAGLTLTSVGFDAPLPTGLTARIIRGASPSHACDGQWLLVRSAGGTYHFGSPWIIADSTGATIEERLQHFAWTRMRTNLTANVDRSRRTPEGFYNVTLHQTTEAGKIPMEGVVDRDGRIFFLGSFQPVASDQAKARVAALQPLVANAPSRGAAAAPVTVVEFSDFQCPSCKRSSGAGDALVERHGDAVRYVRFDLPLINSHPWAFPAALAGRAIYRQNPEAFREYKKQVYEMQDRLSAFTFDDFARGFAADRELDLKRYDADLASPELRAELLKGVGAAFANGVRATPTFMVNGVFVDAESLDGYVASLLKK